MSIKTDVTDVVAYVAEAMRNRLGTITALQPITDSEGNEPSDEEVAAIMVMEADARELG